MITRVVIVKSKLHCKQDEICQSIEEIIQHKSIVESIGNAVYTTALLNWYHDHINTGQSFPKQLVSQTAVRTAYRSVLSQSPIVCNCELVKTVAAMLRP